MVWSPQCIEGNKARGGSVGNLIVKTAESGLGDPLACGEGLRLSTELSDWELGPCEGFLVRGSNED